MNVTLLLKIVALPVIFGITAVIAGSAAAEDAGWLAVGLRAGINDSRNEEDFEQYEGFALYRLPWNRQIASDWTLGTYFEFNAGALTGGGDTGFVGSAGPGINLQTPGKRLMLWAGINPTLISKETFGDEQLGGPFQFTSHIGLSFAIHERISIGYRLQHMSNAGIYNKNPGINLHMLELAYYF